MAGTTVTPTSLFGPAVIGNSAAALYTVPTGTTVTLNRMVITNITAGAVAVTIWLVRSGGTNINGNIVVGASAGGQSMTAGPTEPYIVNALAGAVLNSGDAIWAQAASASALNAFASGWTQ